MKSSGVVREDGYICIQFDNGFVYEFSLDSTTQEFWLEHLSQKQWFTQEVKEQVIALYGGK